MLQKASTTAPESTGGKGKKKNINHREYNASLCARGSLVLWLSPQVIHQWKRLATAQPAVGEYLYPPSIIECCLLLGKQYKQPLRQTTGLVKSLLKLGGLEQLPIPDYTTLCRRQKDLPVEVSKRLEQQLFQGDGRPLNIIIDSTGLKVYGEGEWKVRRHGLLHSTGEKRLRIHFRQAGNLLICTVEDNGVGRQAANAINQRRRAHHTSFATKASQQRLALLRASTRRQIELHYTDLYHGDVPAGTRVVLSLPC